MTTIIPANTNEQTFLVGGVVWGLIPNTTVRLAKGSDEIVVGNDTFFFPTRMEHGENYNATIVTQPFGQTCTISSGNGTVPTATVTTISVQCVAGALSVGGSVTGLQDMTAVSMTHAGVSLSVSANGSFTLPMGFKTGDNYNVTLWANPSGAVCTVSHGSGTVGNSNVVDVQLSCTPSAAPRMSFVTGQKAVVEIGQPNFGTASTSLLRSAQTLSVPMYGGRFSYKAFSIPGGPLYVPDFWSSRVLVFNAVPSSNFASADSVMGLLDANNNPITNDFIEEGHQWMPQSLFGGPGYLILANQTVYNSIYTYPRGFPVVDPNIYIVTGIIDTDCTQSGVAGNGTTDVRIADNMLLAVDNGHHRILIWNPQPTDPTQRINPTTVLGQPNFTSCNASVTGSTFNSPLSMYADDHHFVVADTGNNRILIWNSPVSQIRTGDPADVVLGQSDFVTGTQRAASSTSFTPTSVDSDGVLLAVADEANSRVLIWNTFPTQNGQPADAILGQNDSTSSLCNQSAFSGTSPNAATLCYPYALNVAAPFIMVTDGYNGRLMIFRSAGL